MLAAILLLMTHPTKKAKALSDNPDRDLSWTLDSLHGFCRKEGLEEGNRHLSWSLGTFPDRWMYLNFIFHYYSPSSVDGNESFAGSGIRCDRRTIKVYLRGLKREKVFTEQRVWFGMRTATAYQDDSQPDKAALRGPSTVAVVLAEEGHHPVRMKKKDWLDRGLEAVKGASGVTSFQMLLWGGIDAWSQGWNACLDHIERLYEVPVSNSAPV